MFFYFSWENKRHLISKNTLDLTYELDDLNMMSVKYLVSISYMQTLSPICEFENLHKL